MVPPDDAYAARTAEVLATARERLLAILRSARGCKPMYFSSVEPRPVMDWLSGLRTGCMLVGLEWSPRLRLPALERRGLHLSGAWEDGQLAARGLGPEAIVDELLGIEIEMWEQADESQTVIDAALDSEDTNNS